MDEFEERLRSAAPTVADDTEVRGALAEVAGARSRRRRRLPLVAVVAAGVLALGGVGAAAAVGFGPWRMIDPDFSFTRDWYDVAGDYLGTCESRIQLELLPADVRPVAEEYLATHDIGRLEPNWRTVAVMLAIVGRAERFPELRAGGDVADYGVTLYGHEAAPWAEEVWSDAHVLQTGLDRTLIEAINRELFTRMPGLENQGIVATGETQCSTDPDWLVEMRGNWPDDPSA